MRALGVARPEQRSRCVQAIGSAPARGCHLIDQAAADADPIKRSRKAFRLVRASASQEMRASSSLTSARNTTATVTS